MIGLPRTRSTWKKQFGTAIENVRVTGPVPERVCEAKSTCWDAVASLNEADGAVYETNEASTQQPLAIVTLAVAVPPATALLIPLAVRSEQTAGVSTTGAIGAASCATATVAPGYAVTRRRSDARATTRGVLRMLDLIPFFPTA